jgi:hypothetical protein
MARPEPGARGNHALKQLVAKKWQWQKSMQKFWHHLFFADGSPRAPF